MRLTKLRLNGFKSFVDPTDLVIHEGLTGVVGPNGCGKSNLLEALRWVMGENRPTAMRGGGVEGGDTVDFGQMVQNAIGDAVGAAQNAEQAGLAAASGKADIVNVVTAIAQAERALPAVTRSGNAALQATAMLIKAEALTQLGRLDEANRLRLDSRDLARYGFGTGSDVEARVHEIATLSRRISSN